MKKLITILLLLFVIVLEAQDSDVFDRIQAIHNHGTTFYNVDGIDFSSQILNYSFNEKNLKKVYRKYKIKKNDLKIKDTTLRFQNYHVNNREEISPGSIQGNSYYFIENDNKQIEVFWFGSFDTPDVNFERKMINAIANKEIPEKCFNSLNTKKVNFAGRELKLGGNCNWMNVNNIQCPYYGQMNWSVHKTKESADKAIDTQFNITTSRRGGKVVSEQVVDVEFEGVPTKAKKVIYDFTGVKSLLAGISGGKTLTIYYVSEKVRGNYVSCVMSHWDNDEIRESGLPALLEEVMKIIEK
ncbi:hypothetical protein GTQ40_05985 [Flavobacteriaceae bacterium R38]|nr:hypothetical protein [Flavobacteriaceae bacterium R38]